MCCVVCRDSVWGAGVVFSPCRTKVRAGLRCVLDSTTAAPRHVSCLGFSRTGCRGVVGERRASGLGWWCGSVGFFKPWPSVHSWVWSSRGESQLFQIRGRGSQAEKGGVLCFVSSNEGAACPFAFVGSLQLPPTVQKHTRYINWRLQTDRRCMTGPYNGPVTYPLCSLPLTGWKLG